MSHHSVVDASALSPLFIEDEFTASAEAIAARAERIYLSDWTTAECVSATGRAVRIGLMTRERAQVSCVAMDGWAIRSAVRVDIEAQDIRYAETLLRRFEFNLRAPDALHIALARRVSLRLTTFDQNMAACAKALGLALVNLQN